MKELSKEEKAKAYDVAIEKLRGLLEGIHEENCEIMEEDITNIFPELKESESEDEKIRKEIIYHIQNCDDTIDEVAEKRMVAWLKNQGEQKPADKVEPKFKVGQWIIFNGLILYVNEVIQGYYRTTSIDGIPNSYDWNIDNVSRLWTIQDAKDGDVLAFKNNIGGIIICKSPTYYDTGSYCRFVSDSIINKEESGWDSTLLVPSTKEQSDLLFQKMHEAGYEWDAEKKELNEIKQLTAFEEAVKDMMDDYSDAIGENDATTEEVKKHSEYLLSLIPQKTVEWSEEDEKMVKDIIAAIDTLYYHGMVKWLKSLKDRVQPQWKPSEKQLAALHDAAVYVDNSMFPYPKGILMKMYKQLKKL